MNVRCRLLLLGFRLRLGLRRRLPLDHINLARRLIQRLLHRVHSGLAADGSPCHRVYHGRIALHKRCRQLLQSRRADPRRLACSGQIHALDPGRPHCNRGNHLAAKALGASHICPRRVIYLFSGHDINGFINRIRTEHGANPQSQHNSQANIPLLFLCHYYTPPVFFIERQPRPRHTARPEISAKSAPP